MKLPVPLTITIATILPRPYFGDGDDSTEKPISTGGEDPGNADIMDFAAPDIEAVGDMLSGKPPADITAPPAGPKDPVTPPKKDTPAPTPRTATDGPKQLREELDAVKRERDELKANLEKGDPRLVEAERVVKEREASIAARDTTIKEYERKLAVADPAVSARLRDLDATYDKDAGKFYLSVPELDPGRVGELVKEYHALPFGKPEYREARAVFEGKVNEALGMADGSESRKLGRALDFIERTHEFAVDRPKAEREVNDSAFKLQHQSRRDTHTKKIETVRGQIEQARKIPEGATETDPYHPKIMLDLFTKVLPADQQAAFEKGIPEFINRVVAGTMPRSEQDYAGMTDAQIAESQANEMESVANARAVSVDVMYNGLRALRVIPTLVKEYQRLKAKLKDEGEASPPDPTRSHGEGGNGASDEIATYAPPNLDNLNF